VLSAGHGSALRYSLLHLTGYDLSLDDIKQFRQWGSKTLGLPERGYSSSGFDGTILAWDTLNIDDLDVLLQNPKRGTRTNAN